MFQLNITEEKVTEKTSNDDIKSEKDVKQSIHVGPEVKCDKIDIVQTNNSYDCICCVCTKKVSTMKNNFIKI